MNEHIKRAAADNLFTQEELDDVLKLGQDICDYIEKCCTKLQLDGGIRAGVDHILRNSALPLLSRRPKELIVSMEHDRRPSEPSTSGGG